jgi:protein involved in polysaccharide export with SLBB domain
MNLNTHSIYPSQFGRVTVSTGTAVLFVLLVLALGVGFSIAADSNSPATARNPSPAIAANTGAATDSVGSLDDAHKLMVGDRVSFRIVEDEDESKQLSVLDSGEIEVPYLGRFPAAGQSCRQLARLLKIELENKYYFQATVIIAVDAKAQSRGRVYLVGAVRTPGAQEIPNDEVFTLSKAVIRAGGFTDFANQRKVKVTRRAQASGGKTQTFTVDVAAVLEKGKTQSDLQLESDDLIYVEERMIRL